jgi:uncharacterized protein
MRLNAMLLLAGALIVCLAPMSRSSAQNAASASSAEAPASNPSAQGTASAIFGLSATRVADHAGVLTPGQRAGLESTLDSYERQTTHQLAVLIVPHLAGQDIETYARRTATDFGLGRKGVDNGILLLVAVRERKIRIELGRGFERYISNEAAAAIISREIAPELAAGRFAEGLERGTAALMSRGRAFVAPRQ